MGLPKELEKQIIKAFKLFNKVKDIQEGGSDIDMDSNKYKKILKEYETENKKLNAMQDEYERHAPKEKAQDLLNAIFNDDKKGGK